MNKRGWYIGWMAVAAIFCLLFAGVRAEAQADDSQVRAARMSFLQGTVNVNHIDNTGSDPAQVNMPLPQGVRVSTGQDGQAEIEFEDGSVVRLTPNSSLELTTLTADANGNLTTDLTLDNGLMYAELRAADKFTYSIAAGAVQVSPVVDATVRISMDKPPAVVSVLDGTAQVAGGSASGEGYKTNVNAGETLNGDANDPGRYHLTQQVATNSWDKWNDDRDAAAANETAEQTDVRDGYAGEAGYGWSDLDANGSWYNVPGQGEVWQPNVATDPDFDPYGYGSWVWYPGSGYVWASGYSWGWTPYRCGNWSYWDDFGWGWQPGIGCGGFGGWGFGGGGYVMNIASFPQRYRFQPKPVHDPGRARPIRVGRPIDNPTRVRPVRGIRTIAGRTVEPIRPSPGASSAFKGTTRPIGASLRRDFPVNAPSHRSGNSVTPEPRNPNPSVRMRPEGERPVGRQPGNPVNPGTGMEQRDRATSREMRQQPSTEQRPSPQQQMRPAEQRSMPRYSPPPQQRQSQPHYAPPPPQPHYAPPPQPHYAPPPSAPRSAPSAPAASHK